MKLKKYLTFTYPDYHRALITTLPCILALIFTAYFKLNLVFSIMFVVSATFIGLSHYGTTKRKQNRNLILFAIISALACGLTTAIFAYFSVPWVYLVFFLLLFSILSIPYVLPSTQVAVIIILVFVAVDVLLPKPANLSVSVFATIHAIASFCGVMLCLVVNLILPKSSITPISLDRSSYLFKRAFRICICIIASFVVASALGLKHPSWMAIAVIVVSQANLGASVRKASQRLLGTIAGIIVGIPAALWIFGPYPMTRWFALLSLFICILFAARRYGVAIFFGTFALAATYFALSTLTHGALAFIIDRLIETAIGVVIAILGELLIFPRSIVSCMRTHIKRYWKMVNIEFVDLKQNGVVKNKHCIDDRKSALQIIRVDLADFKYEPLVYLTRRYKMVEDLLSLLSQFEGCMLKLQDKTLATAETELVNSLVDCSSELIRLYEVKVVERHKLIGKILSEHQERLDQLSTDANQLLFSINQQLLKILKQYQKIITTSKWKFS